MSPDRTAATAPVPGGPVEIGIARGMARHALALAPALLVAGFVIGRFQGAWSATLGLALVVANVLAAARISQWAASVSPGALYGAALGGYVVRLAVITGFALAVRNSIDVVAFGLSIVVSQLTLLIWEVRSLASHMPGTDRVGATR